MSHDPHHLAGAYALDALTGTERRRFERHLPGCPTCADETSGLRETATRLALAAARRPPDALRDRVLAEITRTRQAPPPLPRRLPSPRAARGLSRLAAAACLVLALTGGGIAVHLHDRAGRAQALDRQVGVVLTAPDAHASTIHAQGTATVTVVSSRALNRAVVTTARLRRLPAAKTYQMWWLGPAAPRSAGTLDPRGTSKPVITTGLGDARTFGITIEPTGGSPAPTGPPVLTIPLA
ncbi:anti-sigma factor [Actinomadura fibrosa]|uniref:Regulator of SigK n=1 Tax=Actinomadura fibrosa TaxID=111802 RepID=A0ABW2XSJ7_9ACTN|nr:anti-sigma factor [Actinomadura fibrosa]